MSTALRLDSLAARTGQAPEAVEPAYQHLVAEGLVTEQDGTARLTERGQRLLDAVPEYGAAGTEPTPEAVRAAFEGAEDLLRGVSSAVYAQMRDRAAEQEAARDGILASDAERDAATRTLSDAYAAGRVDSAELEERTSRVLAARTHGELDDLLAGLGGYQAARESRPIRKAVFGVVAFVSSPFVLVGTLLALFGSDVGDHVGGLVMLVLFLPGLWALWRWAWPRA